MWKQISWFPTLCEHLETSLWVHYQREQTGLHRILLCTCYLVGINYFFCVALFMGVMGYLQLVLFFCVSVQSQYCFSLLGTTEQETRQNFVLWLNQTIKRFSRTVQISEDCDGEQQEGCYEQMSCSDLQKIVSVFGQLNAWRETCIRNMCSAGSCSP